jgi:Lantibiotic dehydratase, N terminus
MNSLAVSIDPDVGHGVLPYLVIRQAGGRATGMDKLLFLDTSTLIDQCLDLEMECLQHKAIIAGFLQRIIGDMQASPVRTELIHLRRDIHNDRLPRKGLSQQALSAVERALSSIEFQDLSSWLNSRSRRESLARAIQAAFEKELAHARSQLKLLVRGPAFRQALTLASPTLAYELDRYIATAGELKRLRKTELSLVRYYSRCAFKLSPFSSFMLTTLVRLKESSACPERSRSNRIKRSVALNRALIGQLAYLITRHPELRDHTPLFRSGAILEKDGTLWVLRRQYRTAVPARMRVPRETILALPQSPALKWILESFNPDESIKRKDLIAALSQPPNDAEHAVSYVDKLIELGILVPRVPMRADSSEVESIIHFLGNIPSPSAGKIKECLEDLCHIKEKDMGADRSTGRVLLSRTKNALQQSFAEAGVRLDKNWNGTLLYEDWLHASIGVGSFATEEWKPAINDLREFLSCYGSLLDSNLSVRETIHHLLREKHDGGPTPVLSFVHSHKSVFGGDPMREWNWSSFTVNPCGLEKLRLLAVLRRQFSRYISCPSALEEMDLKSLAERCRWSGHVHQLRLAGCADDTFCVSCHCQPVWLSEREAGLVVNVISEGPFRTFLRFCNALGTERKLDETICGIRQLLDETWPQAEPCELLALFDYNANEHPRVTNRRICYEDSPVRRPGDIGLGDLAFEAQDERLLLKELSSGKILRPLDFGMTASAFRTALQHFLLSAGNPEFVLHKNLFHPYHWELEDRVPAAVEEFPRLSFGRCILRRKGWSVARDSLVRRTPGMSDAEHLFSARRWQRSIGLPDEVFVFAETPGGARPENANSPSRRAWNNRKPQYIHFGNHFLLQVLEKFVDETQGRLYFEEMLPDRASWRRWNLQRPTEYVLSVSTKSAPPEPATWRVESPNQ